MAPAQPDRLKLSPSFRRLALLLLLLHGGMGLRTAAISITSGEIYNKDFISPWLMARATLAGVDPYLPLNELAEIFLPHARYDHFTHPTPHTPIMGLLFLPFGLLPYEAAAAAWLLFELVLLGGALIFFLRWWGAPRTGGRLLLLAVLACGWRPLVEDLWFGQVTLLLLLLLTGAWHFLETKREARGGLFLGGLMAIKFIGWPILLYLLARRRWRSVGAALAVVVAANLLAAAVLGADRVATYYTKVGPAVGRLYRLHDYNYSAWALGGKAFEGGGHYHRIAPLVRAPRLAAIAPVLAPGLALLCGLGLCLRRRGDDLAFAVLPGVSILVTPVAWPHYTLLLTIPLLLLARRLRDLGWPRRATLAALGLFAAASWSSAFYNVAAGAFVGRDVPFHIGALNLLPAFAVIGFAALFLRLESREAAAWADPAAANSETAVRYA